MKRKLILGVLLVCLTVLLAIPAAAAAPYANAQALFEAWEREGYPDDVAGVYSVDGGTYLCILLLDDTPERRPRFWPCWRTIPWPSARGPIRRMKCARSRRRSLSGIWAAILRW